MLRPVLTAVLALVATASADCPLWVLQNATAAYVAAQTAGKSATLTAFAVASLNYTENEKPANITGGILSKPLKIDHEIHLHDTAECATFSELIINDATHPYILGVRMLLSNESTPKITFVESLVTTTGDWAFNATGYIYWESKESWDPIPAAKQDSRATIKAAGDAYFDRFANINATVPWGTPCARLEGGAYTGARNLTENTCNLGLPSTITVTNRRYVVDESMGSVVIYVGFPGLDRTQGQKPAPDSHLFRVQGGKLRYIHTISSCVTPGCGSSFKPPVMA